MVVALIAAVAGVGIAMGNYAKYSALEKELRGWFLKVSGIVKVNREIISNFTKNKRAKAVVNILFKKRRFD